MSTNRLLDTINEQVNEFDREWLFINSLLKGKLVSNHRIKLNIQSFLIQSMLLAAESMVSGKLEILKGYKFNKEYFDGKIDESKENNKSQLTQLQQAKEALNKPLD